MNLAKRIAQEFNRVNTEIANLDVPPVLTTPADNATLAPGACRLETIGTYNLPANPATGIQITFRLDCTPTASSKITINRNGENIEGKAEDLTIEDTSVKCWTMYYNGTMWKIC